MQLSSPHLIITMQHRLHISSRHSVKTLQDLRPIPLRTTARRPTHRRRSRAHPFMCRRLSLHRNLSRRVTLIHRPLHTMINQPPVPRLTLCHPRRQTLVMGMQAQHQSMRRRTHLQARTLGHYILHLYGTVHHKPRRRAGEQRTARQATAPTIGQPQFMATP